MAGPGDDNAVPAGRRGRLRASHADREQVIGVLKAAFVQGRLTKDELDLRVGQVLVSRTYADLAALTADLPAGPTGSQPSHETVPAPTNKALMWGACAMMMIIVVLGAMVAAFPVDNVLLQSAGVFAMLIASPIAGTLLLDWWHEKRSRGHRGGGGSGVRAWTGKEH